MLIFNFLQTTWGRRSVPRQLSYWLHYKLDVQALSQKSNETISGSVYSNSVPPLTELTACFWLDGHHGGNYTNSECNVFTLAQSCLNCEFCETLPLKEEGLESVIGWAYS